MKRCGLRPQSLSTAPFDRAQWRPTTCQSATASFEESRVAELARKRAARKQQVINTTGTVWPCDRCSRSCSSRIGLFAHRRTHPSVTQSAVFDGALHVCVCVNRRIGLRYLAITSLSRADVASRTVCSSTHCQEPVATVRYFGLLSVLLALLYVSAVPAIAPCPSVRLSVTRRSF